MRTPPTLVVAASVALGAASFLSAADPSLSLRVPQVTALIAPGAADQQFGILEETPNQRRIRLGEEIKASYPPPEYGEALETPNHRRLRLGEPIVASYAAPDPGVLEETPNHRRARLDSPGAGQYGQPLHP